MAQLALVSRNPLMSMGLSALDHDIVEIRPHDLDEWLEAGNDASVDALVLDFGSPASALRLVGDLRANGRWTPVLLVASTDEAWDSPELRRLPGVDLLRLPLDSARLGAAAESVLRHAKAPPVHRRVEPTEPVAPEPLIEEIQVPFVVPEPTFLASETDDKQPAIAQPRHRISEPAESPTDPPQPVVEAATLAIPEVVAAPPAPEESEPLPVGPVRWDPIPVREVAPEPEPRSTHQRARRPHLKRSHRASRPTTQPVAVAAHGPESAPVAARQSGSQLQRRRATDRLGEQAPPELVTTLLAVADSLYTLAETAEVIVEDAVTRASAGAGTLLVPDGETWRVAAGVGLRPLEFRYQLGSDSWLVTRVGGSKKGVLIEDSDIARQQLHGAPLASRTHLLAVPVTAANAILLLSRDHDPVFDEAVLVEVAQLADEAGAMLQRAVDIRALARRLAHHLDPAGAPSNQD